MKKTLIFFLIALVLVVARFTFLSPTSVLYKIYQAKNGINLNTIIGITPKKFTNSFSEKTIELNEKYVLQELQNLKSPIPEVYYILNQRIIKGYPISLVKKGGEVPKKHQNIDAYLINLEVFNEYITVANINSKEEIVTKFFNFLSDGQSFQRLSNLKDIEMLLSKFSTSQINASQFFGKQVNLEELDFSKTKYYVWFHGKGVIHFDFSFKNQKIEAVKSVNVGLLGIEEIYCC